MFDKPTAAVPKTPPSEADGAQGAQPAARPRRPSAGAEHVAAEPSAVRVRFLYADVMRERGNQYLEHLAQVTPNVLNFEAELIMSGLELARPVNYELVRIVPPEGIELDPLKRPFVVVDPRAGHGPGIGGFKAESEIGVALRAGHTSVGQRYRQEQRQL